MDSNPRSIVNGLDADALGRLVEQLGRAPQRGRVQFATDSRWQHGARVLTRVEGYRIDDEPMHDGQRRFVLLSDEPTELSGTDAAPGPAEQLLHAIGSCVAATINACAAMRGVALDRLQVELLGDVDLHGIFGLDDRVRPGFGEIAARIELTGDADPQELREIGLRGLAASPVADSVRNGVPIRAQLDAQRAQA